MKPNRDLFGFPLTVAARCASTVAALLITCAAASAAGYPFLDDFESGLANWTTNGGWSLTSARFASPSHAVTDSPGSFYTNNTDSALTLASSISLAGATRPALSFQHAYFLENGYDFGTVEVSVNGGVSWITPALAAFTGTQATMTREQIDLSAYAGSANVRVRFHLVTDSSVVMDGWYVDDVRIAEAPAPVTLTATQTNRNSVALAWTASAAPNFAAYRVYRSLSAGVDWRAAQLVSEITSAATLNATDIMASPKTKYFYRVAVVATDGLLTLGNEIQVTTLPGMDYPFLDNGEGGSATWVADAPWTLSTEDAASPTRAWSDSPGTNYANGIASQSLTLAAPAFLAGRAVAPVLSFNHKYDFGPGDSGNVELSINNGADWSLLASFTGTATNTWLRGRYSLAAYTNAAVLVRFRITSDASAPADGWHLDDISLAESPTVVPAPIIDNVTSHSLRLTWEANADTFFSRYAIFRSTSPGVGINSTLVATFTNQSTTTFTDINLALDTPYYYRVYAVSPYGTFSPDSASERSARTLNNPPPFSDGFEAGLLNWNLTGTWGLTTNGTHSGSYALADSPVGDYANSVDTSAQTAVNLVGTVWPVLRFWDRVRLNSGDWGRLEVSSDGGNWSCLYGVSEYQIRDGWAEQSLDLSPWKGQSNLRIRFRLWSDGSGTEDGWTIDDLSVAEHTPVAISYPFYENFEHGLTNWLHASWGTDTNAPYAGSWAARDTASGRIPPSTALWLELAGGLNLSNAVNPQLTCWVRGYLGAYAYLRVHVSTDGGVSWGTLSGLNLDAGFSAGWTRMQASLSAYTNQTVRLRFETSCDWRAPDEDLWLDNLTVADLPAAVVLETTTPHLKTVDLRWSASTLGGAFRRTEVYRATHPSVTLGDTLIGTFTNASATSLTDTGLSIGATYYYKVYTVDTHDTYVESNERSTTTVPLNLPVVDGLETMDQWVATGTWGITTNGPRSGAGALADSPVGDYANSVDTSAQTAVNLVGTVWPVLRFWDRVRLNSGDWGRLEVSSDGGNWSCLYGVSEYQIRDGWAEQSLDLSPWKGQSNLRIRFRLWSDGSGTEDGWTIDDLSVAEHTPVAISYPFYENFEHGLTNWLHASWGTDTNAPYAGSWAARDTASGRIPPSTALWLELAGGLNLSNAVNPQLTCWVRGYLGAYAYLRVHVSTDGGVSWGTLSGLNLDAGFSAGWTRMQASLSAYTNQTVRLRFETSCDWRAPDEDLWLDNLTVADLPAAVVLETTTPHLKTVDLRWSASTLGGAFRRTEVYRATHPSVTLGDTLIGTFTNASATSLTDTGLSIGATYYYKVYTVDTHDTYVESNERSTTTVPLNLPVVDGLETMDQWVATGTWGITTNGPRSGAGALADSPVGDYANSVDTSAQTAVNLVGTVWPVLRFWDRVRLNSGDWGRLEVSSDGGNWSCLYGVSEYQIRDGWAEQSLDLSPWKGQSNLRIRFRLWSDGSGTEDGWTIDDLSVAEHTPVAISYPFYENFEHGLTNWLHASWGTDTNAPYAGSWAARDTASGRIPPSTALWLELAGGLNLSNAVNPQLTCWVRGYLGAYAYLRVHVSTDGGVSWGTLSGLNLDAGFSAGWTRMQASLSAYTNQTVRLRFETSCDWRAPDEDLWLDNLTVADLPAAVVLETTTPHLKTVDLRWSASTLGGAFRRTEVYRATHPSVTLGDTLIGTFTNASVTSLTDTGLSIGATYYYKVYTVDTHDTYVESNERSTTTVPLNLPVVDGLETMDQWVATGTWGITTNGPRSGAGALADSPVGDYANSVDTSAQTAVNLVGTVWPVLRFWDRVRLNSGDWGRLEVSSDGGNWSCLYGVSEYQIRDGWAEQSLDLSPWKGQSNLRIRFRLWSDGSGTEDGWTIDDLSVAEHTPVAISYPFYENFEHGLTNWLHASWGTDTNAPYAGSWAARDTASGRIPPSTALWLELAGGLNLSNAVNPQLTCWVRGYLGAYAYLRVHVSTDGGVSWGTLSGLNLDAGFSAGWTRMQASLSAYTNQTVRLRFETSCDWRAPDEDLWLDNLGIGGVEPGTPTLKAPAHLATADVVRPTLVVNNADSYQGAPLAYRFEVYSDAALSNLVSQVPGVASGVDTTSWQVDVNLQNNSEYWWRCRATDGTNVGPWMATASFYVNELNHPPLPVEIIGPPDGTLITNLSDPLVWLPTTDPDEGDTIVFYHVQVDTNAAFSTPTINVTNIPVLTLPGGAYWAVAMPLNDLAGATNLALGNLYHWRIRAQDNRYGWSAWSAGDHTFKFGRVPPRPARISGLRPGAGGRLLLDWTEPQDRIFVEYSPSLVAPVWQTVAGPLSGTNWTFTPLTGSFSGFYRLRSE